MTYVDIADAQLWLEDGGGDGTPLVLMHALYTGLVGTLQEAALLGGLLCTDPRDGG